MNPDREWDALRAFVRCRIAQGATIPTVACTAAKILAAAESWDATADDDDAYHLGYADAMEDALRLISGMWRYHEDYEGWADDE